MSTLILISGVALLALVVLDSLWTTVIPAGAGPLTTLTTRVMWGAALRLPATGRSYVLPLMGSCILLTAIMIWVLLLWMAWWLVFTADASSVVSSDSHLHATGWERAYFVGFSAFTLGVGDFVPGSDLWRICTAVASFSGLFLITLSITYLLPVLSAATQQRQLSAMICDLGGPPTAIVNEMWDGESFSALTSHLTQVWPLLEIHHQRHSSYPVLHYFRSRHRDTAAAVAVARLYDAIVILDCGVAAQHRPPESRLQPVRKAIEGLLRSLEGDFIAASREPPLPNLAEIDEAIRLDEAAWRRAASRHRGVRRLLGGFIEQSGWNWDDVLTLSDGSA